MMRHTRLLDGLVLTICLHVLRLPVAVAPLPLGVRGTALLACLIPAPSFANALSTSRL